MLVFGSPYLYYYCLFFENFIHLSNKILATNTLFSFHFSPFFITLPSPTCLFLSFLTVRYNQHYPYVLRCGTMHWIIGKLSGHTFNEKMSFPFVTIIICQLFLIKGRPGDNLTYLWRNFLQAWSSTCLVEVQLTCFMNAKERHVQKTFGNIPPDASVLTFFLPTFLRDLGVLGPNSLQWTGP